MRFRSILLAALVLASGNVLATDGHEHGPAGGMMACGMMHGGKMTAEEQRKHADTMFRTLDANADGSITRAEFDRHHEDMMKQRTSAAQDRKEHDKPGQQK